MKEMSNETQELRSRVSQLEEQENAFPSIPSGAVLAFDNRNGCPEGWAPFEKAVGRSIFGARFPESNISDAAVLDLGDTGGEVIVRLTVRQLPRHTHALSFEHDHRAQHIIEIGHLDNSLGWEGVRGKNHNTNAGFPTRIAVTTDPAGSDQPHNNMPPYIALYFCKKL